MYRLDSSTDSVRARSLDGVVPGVLLRPPSEPGVVGLEHIAGKWGVLVLAALREGPYRFNALRRRVDGVSEKPRVEYSLTPLGVQLADRVVDLIEVLQESVPEITAAQQRYDAAHEPASERSEPAAAAGQRD